MMDTDPEIQKNKEERFWCVDGTIRYTLKDGSRHRYRFCSRNVAAFDIKDAADNELEKISQLLSDRYYLWKFMVNLTKKRLILISFFLSI